MTSFSEFLDVKTAEIDTVEKRAAFTVTIVGCGQEGLAYGIAFAETGFKVAFVDSDQSLVKRLTKGRLSFSEREIESKLRTNLRTGRVTVTSDLKNTISQSNAVMVTINPKLDEKNSIDYSELEKIFKQIGTNLKRGTVVIYAGMASFGFMESVVREALINASGFKLGEDFGLAYSPPLVFNLHSTLGAISSFELKVAANDKVSLDSASALLSTITRKSVDKIMNFRKAELAMLFSAIRIEVNVALANELAILCENAGIDYLEILKLVNSQQNLSSLAPAIDQNVREEVYALIENAENLNTKLRLATLAIQLNEDIIRHAVNLTQNALRSSGRTLRRSKITVFGKTGTGTPGGTFVKMLEKKGAKTIVYGPNALASDSPYRREKPKRNVTDTVEGADCLVLLQGQESLKNISLKSLRTVMRSPPAIVDLAGTIDPEKAETEGFIYRGLGRGTGKK